MHAHTLDPLQVSRHIAEDYQQYIQASFPVRHATLRTQFASLIGRPNFSSRVPTWKEHRLSSAHNPCRR